MASVAKNPRPAWQATLKWERRVFERAPPKHKRTRLNQPKTPGTNASDAEKLETLPAPCEEIDEEPFERITIRVCFVCFSRPGIDPIRFRVNPLKDGRFV
jgi:hypothetical protein